jgi:hypothetical protein
MSTAHQDLHVMLGRSHAENVALKEQLREAVRLLEDCEPYSRLSGSEWREVDIRKNAFLAALAKAECVKEQP